MDDSTNIILTIMQGLQENIFLNYSSEDGIKSWGIAFSFNHLITEDFFSFSPSLTFKVKKAKDYLPIDGEPLSPQFILNNCDGKWKLSFEFYFDKYCYLDNNFSWTIFPNIDDVYYLLEKLLIFDIYVYDITGSKIF